MSYIIEVINIWFSGININRTSKVWQNLTIVSQGTSEFAIISNRSWWNHSEVIIRIYKIVVLWKEFENKLQKIPKIVIFSAQGLFAVGQFAVRKKNVT